MIAWPVSVVGDGWWKVPASLACAVSFAVLSQSKLPLERASRLALAWCMCGALVFAMFELSAPRNVAVDVSNLLVAKAWVFGWIVMLMSITLAFCTAMQGLARVAGSQASVEQWRSVLAWQLGSLCVGLLVISVAGLQSNYTTGSFLMFLLVVMVPLLVSICLVLVYPILALHQLRLRLRECRTRQGG